MENFLKLQRPFIFSQVEVLLYVFDVSSQNEEVSFLYSFFRLSFFFVFNLIFLLVLSSHFLLFFVFIFFRIFHTFFCSWFFLSLFYWNLRKEQLCFLFSFLFFFILIHSLQKDFAYYSAVLDALKEFSSDARIFILIHKIDLIVDEQKRQAVFLDKVTIRKTENAEKQEQT